MLIDQKDTHKVVRQIVAQITPNRALHEDLTQEAIIHLWRRETEFPGQTRSWYLKSARFFLLNQMRNGRSVDAAKRQDVMCSLVEAYDCSGMSTEEAASGGSVLAQVSVREASVLLARWLTPAERDIFEHLLDGYGVREVASRLGVSHTTVLRCRRRVASLAARLGIKSAFTPSIKVIARIKPQPRRSAATRRNQAPRPRAKAA